MKKNHGFTLVELIIVIIITAILAAGVYLQWSSSSINLAAQAQQLANDIRYAQSLSMTKGGRYRWTKTSSNTYQIVNSTGTAILNPSGNTTTTLTNGISFGALTNLPNSLIAFDDRGIPYTDTGTPGTQLSATATIPVTANGVTMTISILSQTGNVTVQ